MQKCQVYKVDSFVHLTRSPILNYDLPMKKSKKRSTTNKIKKSSPKKSHSKPQKITTPKNKAGITPLGERVLVKPFTPEEAGKTTSFGIIIPETVDKEKPEQGLVIAVGPGKKNEAGNVVPLSVQVGDKVMFSKYGYDEIKVNGVEYYMVAESSILAILD